MPRLACVLVVSAVLAVPAGLQAQASMRARYDAAQAAGPGGSGQWYRDRTNEDGLLSWGTSYAMMSFLVMYEATGEARYLERLAYIADGVLSRRDSERGITDYRGESLPCWQSTRYSDGNPYCWAVHDGMILFPMVELAVAVEGDPALADVVTYDGASLGDKAEAYVEAGRVGSAVHDRQWQQSADSGYYVFPADATFTARPGERMPLNQMNALGRLQIALCDATGEDLYCERARRLANHLRAFFETQPSGGYAWSYWPEAYSPPGEDVSHAAINVGLAARAARSGIVFEDAHLDALARTFFRQIYVDQRTSYDHVGGTGSQNGSSYRPQIGRWLVLDERHASVHAAVRDAYAGMETTSSGSVLLGMAHLAATDHIQVPHRFYVADWSDEGDYRKATAYGANFLITPPDPDRRCLVRLRYRAVRRTAVQQWDGDAYHTVARLAPTGGEIDVAHVPYEPAWYHDYGGDGVLYQFDDDFVAGEGIELFEAQMHEPPSIETSPPIEATAGTPYGYEPEASGDTPHVWTVDGPAAMTVRPGTGRIEWTPAAAGEHDVTLEVGNDWGTDTQSWTITVRAAPGSDAGTAGDAGAAGDAGTVGDAGATTDGSAARDAGPADGDAGSSGCGCGVPGRSTRGGPTAFIGVLAGWLIAARRRRP